MVELAIQIQQETPPLPGEHTYNCTRMKQGKSSMPEILVTFKNSLSQLRSSPMKLSALRGGEKEDLKKVCTIAMGYTSNGDDYQSSHI